MNMRQFQTMLLSSELRDLADDVARLFDDWERETGRPFDAAIGECTPALDVLEGESTVEIELDVPGVTPSDVRVLIKAGVVVIVGEKRALNPAERTQASFHLVERGFGRFARVVRLNGAFDGGRASATLTDGELRIVVPKIVERRGRNIRVPVAEPAHE
jgi:HSP20 family protein